MCAIILISNAEEVKKPVNKHNQPFLPFPPLSALFMKKTDLPFTAYLAPVRPCFRILLETECLRHTGTMHTFARTFFEHQSTHTHTHSSRATLVNFRRACRHTMLNSPKTRGQILAKTYDE